MRIGFDIGGTKLAAIALDEHGVQLALTRRNVPRDYWATVDAVRAIVAEFERAHCRTAMVGVGMPGMIGTSGEVQVAVNLPWLQGRPLRADLELALDRPVAIANDANCFTLSEAVDGSAAGARIVFGATLGTGVGGGIVVGGTPLVGANAIAGEWGHNPLPPVGAEHGPAVRCGCGRTGCIETWLNGAALAADYQRVAGAALSAERVATRAANGDASAREAVARYARRLALALAGVVNVLDPDVIVLGGGLSSIASLYVDVPRAWGDAIVTPKPRTRLTRARFGPESGLRGAAWLSHDAA